MPRTDVFGPADKSQPILRVTLELEVANRDESVAVGKQVADTLGLRFHHRRIDIKTELVDRRSIV